MFLILTEKPSVAFAFAKALGVKTTKKDGYIESSNTIITWCVGHLIAMSYPEKYDASLKKWSLDTLPFIPDTYKYETIKAVSKQFKIVKSLFERADVDTIYACTDSAREGEYIFRLVLQQCNQSKVKKKKILRVWIDSQTDEEVKRGLKEAKPLTDYDNLSASAYCRAKEDYLIGINFSRALTLKKAYNLKRSLGLDKCVIAVGRVMTCVLGMVVNRENEIKNFKKTTYYNIKADIEGNEFIWKPATNNNYTLYNNAGFLKLDDANDFIKGLDTKGVIFDISRKKSAKTAPLLYNLAELQNECSKQFKISPDETLQIVQDLYEKKLVTYPRTDARVLSSAVAKEIDKTISGLVSYMDKTASYILSNKTYVGIEKTKYVDDSKISDHYAIIPTGQALNELNNMDSLHKNIFDLIVRRLLAIFLPKAEYEKVKIEAKFGNECFVLQASILANVGFLGLYPSSIKDTDKNLVNWLNTLKKGQEKQAVFSTKESETKPPSRYNSGSLILAMENAGKLIEDEELREHIKSSGIGTSATRAETLKKLVKNKYLSLNKKTQIITPTDLGKGIYDVVNSTLPALLNPTYTASWEKGLMQVAEGKVSEEEFMNKLNGYVASSVNKLKTL